MLVVHKIEYLKQAFANEFKKKLRTCSNCLLLKKNILFLFFLQLNYK